MYIVQVGRFWIRTFCPEGANTTVSITVLASLGKKMSKLSFSAVVASCDIAATALSASQCYILMAGVCQRSLSVL